MASSIKMYAAPNWTPKMEARIACWDQVGTNRPLLTLLVQVGPGVALAEIGQAHDAAIVFAAKATNTLDQSDEDENTYDAKSKGNCEGTIWRQHG